MTRHRVRSIDHVRCPGGGKLAYMTKKAARRALHDLRAKHIENGNNVDPRWWVYECPTCHLWHVGTDLRRTPSP